MPDQAAAPAVIDPPTRSAERALGPAVDADAGGRVIPLDTRRRRPSPDPVAASRACHPAQLWAEMLSRRSSPEPTESTAS